MGFGKKLIRIAETIAWNNNYHYIAIISAVGTREYYKKFGKRRLQHKHYEIMGYSTSRGEDPGDCHLWMEQERENATQ